MPTPARTRTGSRPSLRSGRRAHYSVYVIELDRAVLLEARFLKSNPQYQSGQPCVYVGMTGQSPDVRMDKHKAGIKANRFAQTYGLRLMPEIYEAYNPMTQDEAKQMEVDLAIDLREGGWGVWQA
jgi:hypothetical protein